ncbi:MAG: MFS transporter, partial [Alphaproteobacteria bacterium]|nr:MFS transporter [Alphaproteobacteria bacterium]
MAPCRTASSAGGGRSVLETKKEIQGEEYLNPNYAAEVGARLDRLPFTRTIWKYVVLIALGGVFELYDLFLTAYIAPGLVKSGMFVAKPNGFFDPHGVGFFVFCTFAGMFVGTMGFGFIADRMGRRAIFTFSLLWYCIASTIMAFQTTAEGVDLWRFIAAVGIGLEQVTIDTFIPELVPPQGRGRAFAIYQFIAFLIVPVVAFLAYKLVPIAPWGWDGWRWVVLGSAVGAFAAWVLRLGLPESPRWLARHGEVDRAEAIMKNIEALVQRDTGGVPLPPVGSAIVERAGNSTLAELFKPPFLSRTVMMSLFNILSVVGYYGFAAWVPTLLIDKGITVTRSLEYAFIIAIANPVGPLLGFLVADKMERKWQLVSAGALVGVFILLFSLQTDPWLIIALGVCVTLANNWISFVFHGYQAEQYPTRIRARGVGFVYSWSRVSSALQGLLIGFFLKEGGAIGVAAFIGIAMLIMCGTVALFG